MNADPADSDGDRQLVPAHRVGNAAPPELEEELVGVARAIVIQLELVDEVVPRVRALAAEAVRLEPEVFRELYRALVGACDAQDRLSLACELRHLLLLLEGEREAVLAEVLPEHGSVDLHAREKDARKTTLHGNLLACAEGILK